MSGAIAFIVLMVLGTLAESYNAVNAGLTWQNVLLASGIIGICLRLDKIAKQGKGHK
jgi:hypothetical protein